MGPNDCIGVIISTYSDTQITFTFGSGYGTGAGQYGVFSPGDNFQMNVLGATYNGIVPFSETPTIDGVTFGGDPTNPTVIVSGAGFDTQSYLSTAVPATDYCNSDTGYDYGNSFYFSDNTNSWQAGQGGNCVGLLISTYTANQIIFTFGTEYSTFGPVKNGDSFSVKLFGVAFNGTASLGTGYTCVVSGFGTTDFPAVVSESPAPPSSIDLGGTFQTAPATQLTIPASVINDFIGEGATSLTVAPRPPPSTAAPRSGDPQRGGQPQHRVGLGLEPAHRATPLVGNTPSPTTPPTTRSASRPAREPERSSSPPGPSTPRSPLSSVARRLGIHLLHAPDRGGRPRLNHGEAGPHHRPSRCPRPLRPFRTRSARAPTAGGGRRSPTPRRYRSPGSRPACRSPTATAPPPSTCPAWPPRAPPVRRPPGQADLFDRDPGGRGR